MTRPTLTDAQALRYSRHLMLPALDFVGQEQLLASRVLVVGLGGLGCAAAPYLAGAGVGTLYLADDDTIDRTNLQRQILFRESDVGEHKAEVAARVLQQQNSELHIEPLVTRLAEARLNELLTQVDLVLDCTDNLTTRQLLNRCCFAHSRPLISGAAIRLEGQVATYPMTAGAPCYQCFSRLFGEQQLTCMEAGVLAPVVGVIGSMQAVEALKVLTGVGQPLTGQVLLYDASVAQWQSLSLKAQPDCPVCGT